LPLPLLLFVDFSLPSPLPLPLLLLLQLPLLLQLLPPPPNCLCFWHHQAAPPSKVGVMIFVLLAVAVFAVFVGIVPGAIVVNNTMPGLQC
jgi:hypothetical protein